jgi:colanic acid/amylovoran biosynthesis glycosyltransferase
VRFLGNISNDGVDYYYDLATVFVLPCVKAPDGDMDGIPVALMEAMASGIPVVSTNISGIPELIEDGKSGILVPEKDPRGLAEAIKAILSDVDMRKKFAVEGRKKVVSDFNIRDVAEKLNQLFASHMLQRE